MTAVQGTGGLNPGYHAELRFLMPTSEAMLAGVLLPVAGLRPAALTERDVSRQPPGSSVIARLPPGATGADARLWRECQLVGFEQGGRAVTVQPQVGTRP